MSASDRIDRGGIGEIGRGEIAPARPRRPRRARRPPAFRAVPAASAVTRAGSPSRLAAPKRVSAGASVLCARTARTPRRDPRRRTSRESCSSPASTLPTTSGSGSAAKACEHLDVVLAAELPALQQRRRVSQEPDALPRVRASVPRRWPCRAKVSDGHGPTVIPALVRVRVDPGRSRLGLEASRPARPWSAVRSGSSSRAVHG